MNLHAEHYVSLGLFPDRFVDHVMIRGHFLFPCECEILKTGIFLLKVHVAEATVEEDLAGVKLELEAQLLIIDVGVSSQVQQGVIEICQRLLKVTHEEVGDTLLEVCNCEVLVELDRALVAFHLYASLVSSLPTLPDRIPRTARSCSPMVAWITPQLNRILEVSAMASNIRSDSSNS